MTMFHAVMLDETGCEFGADVVAKDKAEAHDILKEEYPESQCVQLESPKDTERRERAMHDHIAQGGDWDDEGRPIFPGGEPDDDGDQGTPSYRRAYHGEF